MHLGSTFLAGALVCVLLAVAVGGCSKSKSDDDLVLATVADVEITGAVYKAKLAKFKEHELPRGEDGELLDTATMAGREAFLAILINKETMQLKAVELGYDKEADVEAARNQLYDYYASQLLYEDAIETPANVISDEALAEYVSHMGEKRLCDFLITNFEDDAREARAKALAGTPWDELVAEYHDGDMSPTGRNEITVPWGQFQDSFESAVFAVEEGGVTEPIPTTYGFWLMHVRQIKNDPPPDVDAIKPKVLDSIRQRKINLARNEFKDEVREAHDFVLDDESLWICYEGLPENESIIDPETGKPTPREQLQPLKIDAADLDRLLYSFTTIDGPETSNIGEYKSRFDRMNAFQRPKRSEMLGGLRQKLIGELDKVIMTDESIKRGYRDDPRVVELAMNQINQMMVTRLHDDGLVIDETVTKEQLEQFWAEHKQDYAQPERRSGTLVDCDSQASAERARAALLAGEDFRAVLDKFGVDAVNKKNGGRFGPLKAGVEHPIVTPLFRLANIGDVTEPIEVRDQYVVIVLTEIEPGGVPELGEFREAVAQRIRASRKEDELNRLLDQWQHEYGVTIDELNLAKMPSWQELTAPLEDVQPVL
jgi:parvulin-like peptidyl-prolyl isomerase